MSSFTLLHRTLGLAQRTAMAKSAPIPSSSPLYGTLLLSASPSRLVVPWVIALGILAMIGGALIMSWGGIARAIKGRTSTRAAADAVEAPSEMGEAS